MKIAMSIIFTILTLTTTSSVLADDDGTTTNNGEKQSEVRCTPAPRCEQDQSNDPNNFTIKQLIDRLTMQQLLELLKTQQEEPEEETKAHQE